MVRLYVCKGFTIGVFPTAHKILDLDCLFGIGTSIERGNVLQGCPKELKPLDRSVTVVKILVNVRVRNWGGDRFAFLGELSLKIRYHSLLVFDWIGSEDGSHAGDCLASSIFAVARRKDGLPIEMVSHGDDDVRKQMQGC